MYITIQIILLLCMYSFPYEIVSQFWINYVIVKKTKLLQFNNSSFYI